MANSQVYLQQPSTQKFSLQKTENLAVKVAKKLIQVISVPPKPTWKVDLASYIKEVSNVEFTRCLQMLENLVPLKGLGDFIRVAYAIIGYLPCFDKDDNEAEEPYKGYPSFPVHGRILSARFIKIRNVEKLELVFLAMNSILAGRLYTLIIDDYVAEWFCKKVYSGRVVAPLVGLSGCYMALPSELLYKQITRKDIRNIFLNTEEKSRNKSLYKEREKNKNCQQSKSCYTCLSGRDKCRLAIRPKTIEVKNDISRTDKTTD